MAQFNIVLVLGAMASVAHAGHLAIASWNDNASCTNAPNRVAIHNTNRCQYEAGSGYWKYACSAGSNGVYSKASAMYCGNDSNCYHCTEIPVTALETCNKSGATKSYQLLCADRLDSIGLPEAWLRASLPADATSGSYYTISDFTTNGNNQCAVGTHSLDQTLNVFPTNNCLLNADGKSDGKYSLYTCDGAKATVYDCGSDSQCLPSSCTQHVQPLGCNSNPTGSTLHACRSPMSEFRFVDGVEDSHVSASANSTASTVEAPSKTSVPLAYTTPGDGSNTFTCGQVHTDGAGVAHTYYGGHGADAMSTYTSGQVFTENGFYFTYSGNVCSSTAAPQPTGTTTSPNAGTTTTPVNTAPSTVNPSATDSQVQPTATNQPGTASSALVSSLSALAGIAISLWL